jgi:competence protein ComEC
MAAFGIGPLILASVGLVLLGLLRTALRWSGAVALVIACIWALAARAPDVLVAADGGSVAVRGPDGRLRLMRTGKDTFLVRDWLASDGDRRDPNDPSLSEGVACDGEGCVAVTSENRRIALALKPSALADDCRRAALIVTAHPAPADCAAQIVSVDDLKRSGALALHARGGQFENEAVAPRGVTRPWMPQTARDAPSAESNGIRPTLSVPIDATPAETDPRADE